jgi:hypothetical protein
MNTFSDANQTRLMLKMKYSQYSWYSSSRVMPDGDNYSIIVSVHKLDNQVRKIVPPVVNGVSVKMEVE